MNEDLKKAIEEARRKEMEIGDENISINLSENELYLIGVCLHLVIGSLLENANISDDLEEKVTTVAVVQDIMKVDDKLFEAIG